MQLIIVRSGQSELPASGLPGRLGRVASAPHRWAQEPAKPIGLAARRTESAGGRVVEQAVAALDIRRWGQALVTGHEPKQFRVRVRAALDQTIDGSKAFPAAVNVSQRRLDSYLSGMIGQQRILSSVPKGSSSACRDSRMSKVLNEFLHRAPASPGLTGMPGRYS